MFLEEELDGPSNEVTLKIKGPFENCNDANATLSKFVHVNLSGDGKNVSKTCHGHIYHTHSSCFITNPE